MRHGIWATLDCDPTTDRGAIRRAYAARLKAMDVDADPDAFEALRNARDAALARAADPVAAVEVEPAMADDPPPPEPEAAPEADPLVEAMNAHFHALEALLFPGHDAAPTPQELAEIDHHGRALLADPRLETLDFAASAERWFAETLAASIPRSDPLLEPAAAAFGWIDRRNDYALSADAHAIVERIGATRFTVLLSDPKHRFHRAWNELNRADGQRRAWFLRRSQRRELLSLIRSRFPLVEGWLEPHRVSEADDTTSPIAGVTIWAIILVIVTLLRLFTSGSEQREVPPASPPPISVAVDPAPAARDMTGMGLAELTEKNPELADDIVKTAASLQGETDRRRIGQAFLDLARWRVQSGLANAPDALLRDIARFEADAKKALAKSDPIQCDDFRFPAGDQLLIPVTTERQTTLVHRTIVESDRRQLATVGRFLIPGKIVEDVQRRTGLPDARFEDALMRKGEHSDICRTDIALREAALTHGKAGLKLLRNLQPHVASAKPTISK